MQLMSRCSRGCGAVAVFEWERLGAHRYCDEECTVYVGRLEGEARDGMGTARDR